MVQLIPRSTGFPLQIRSGNVFGNGNFVKNDSKYCHHLILLNLRFKKNDSVKIYYSVLISDLSWFKN